MRLTAEKPAKVGSITGHQNLTSEGCRRSQNQAILVGEPMAFRRVEPRGDSRDRQPQDKFVEERQSRRRLGGHVAAGFIEDVAVHPAFVSGVKKRGDQRPDRSVGLHRREQDVGVEKDLQGRGHARRFRRVVRERGEGRMTRASSASDSSNSRIRRSV